jgi:tripartite-type tricarboxylate transporter receptor subunit TctC
MRIKTIIAAALGLILAGAASPRAQEWPTRPVTMVVPFPAGGTADMFAREIAAAMEPGAIASEIAR